MKTNLVNLLVLLTLAQASAKDSKAGLVGHHKNQDEVAEKYFHSPKARAMTLPEALKGKHQATAVPHKFVHKANAKLQRRTDLKKGARAPRGLLHEVVFAVQQQNLDKLETLLHDVSDPRSANFGKHLTKAELTAMTGSPNSRQHIVSFLKLHGATVHADTHGRGPNYVTAEAPIHVWEAMLSAEFHQYSHKTTGAKVVRTESYSLPEALAAHVSAAFNTVQFPDERVLAHQQPAVIRKKVTERLVPSQRDHKKRAAKGAQDKQTDTIIYDGYVTPDLINEVYSVFSNTGNSLGSQCLYESINQSYSPSDLTSFQTFYNLPVEAVAVDIGGHAFDNACYYDDANDCVEANLDVQYMMAVSQVTPTTYYYWNGTDFMLDFVTAVANMANPPKVISISYSAYEESYTDDYLDQFNTEAMKLGAMGVTLVSASGDDGVAGYALRNQPSYYCAYYPQFPASSPYVTAVGGTQGLESGNTEIACQSNEGGGITTGGGFSTYYTAPDWQSSFISAYFAGVSDTTEAPASGYATNGRGYPDVSGMAHSYLVTLAGEQYGVDGTSASTPVFGAFVSLVNAARLKAGKSTLGWINPSLYALYASFANDVTSGLNNCVAGGSPCCTQGFYATSGWDPVTGLGSVNYTGFYHSMYALGDNPNQPTLQPTPLFTAPTYLPTHKPTPLPTVTGVPSFMPSQAPKLANGWVYNWDYSETNCEGTVYETYAWPTNTCYTTYGEFGAVTGSIMYSCDTSYVYYSQYSDAGCTQSLGTYQIPQACDASEYYAYGDYYYSTQLGCTATTALPLPATPTATYSILNFYDSGSQDTSNADVLSMMIAFTDGYCFVGDGFSWEYDYPNQMFYDDDTCTNYVGSEVVNPTCYPLNEQYYYAESEEEEEAPAHTHAKKAAAHKHHQEPARKSHNDKHRSLKEKETADESTYSSGYYYASGGYYYYSSPYSMAQWTSYNTGGPQPTKQPTASGPTAKPNTPGPTARPNTAKPSFAPSPVPPQGWLYASYYKGGSVDANVIASQGYVTNKCFTEFWDGRAVGSYMYTCSVDAQTYTYTEWGNADCSGLYIYVGRKPLNWNGVDDDAFYYYYLSYYTADDHTPSSHGEERKRGHGGKPHTQAAQKLAAKKMNEVKQAREVKQALSERKKTVAPDAARHERPVTATNRRSSTNKKRRNVVLTETPSPAPAPNDDDDFFHFADDLFNDDFWNFDDIFGDDETSSTDDETSSADDDFSPWDDDFASDDDFWPTDDFPWPTDDFSRPNITDDAWPTDDFLPWDDDSTDDISWDDDGSYSSSSYYYNQWDVDVQYDSMYLYCAASSALPTPHGYSFATNMSYDTATDCTEQQPMSYVAFKQNTCLISGNGSLVYNLPVIDEYFDTTCSGAVVGWSQLEGVCAASSTYDAIPTAETGASAPREWDMEEPKKRVAPVPAIKFQLKSMIDQNVVSDLKARKHLTRAQTALLRRKMGKAPHSSSSRRKATEQKRSKKAVAAAPAPAKKHLRTATHHLSEAAVAKPHQKQQQQQEKARRGAAKKAPVHKKGTAKKQQKDSVDGIYSYFDDQWFNLDDYYFSYGYYDYSYWYSYTGWDDDTYSPSQDDVWHNDDDFSADHYPYYQWQVTVAGAPTQRPTAFPTYPHTAVPTVKPGYPSRLPTEAPSRHPTMAPTKAQTYSFTVAQTLKGISYSTYVSNMTTNNYVMQIAVSSTMSGIFTSNIIILSVSAVSGRRLTAIEPLASTDACLVTYSVNYDLAALGYYNDPQGAYNSLTQQLNTAVNNTMFDTYLQSAATNVGATSMQAVTSNSETAGPYTDTSSTINSLSDDSTSGGNGQTGVIAGVIVGVVLFLAIGVAVYMYMRGPISNRESDVAKGDSVHETAVNAMFSNPSAAPAAVAVPVPAPPRNVKGDENEGAVELADYRSPTSSAATSPEN